MVFVSHIIMSVILELIIMDLKQTDEIQRKSFLIEFIEPKMQLGKIYQRRIAKPTLAYMQISL